jgi:hypothetical protein
MSIGQILLEIYNTLVYVNQYYETIYLFIKSWLSSRPDFPKLCDTAIR